MRTICLLISVLMLAASSELRCAGEFYVADVFADHAVLQRGVELPIWGGATAGDEVIVQFAGQEVTTHASDDGSWQVMLSPLAASATGERMTVESGEKRIEFRDVLVGEVWYASGQSNMQMTLQSCVRKIPALRDISENHRTEQIRVLRVNEPDSSTPLKQYANATTWQTDSPANRQRTSAVAFLFARQLYEQLEIPIGMIEASWGGKPIEGFIPRTHFETHDTLKRVLSLAQQDKLDELARIKGGVIIRNTAGMPSHIFNSRVSPIAPYKIRGCIWYQGESNAGRGEDPRDYRFKMQALIEGWRETWNQPNMPFYFVQLPAFNDAATGWIRLREEQRRSLAIENTGMAVTIDLRDADIHPANKLDVADRLARWALAKTYGQKIPFSGPLFRSATVVNGSIQVQFDHADGGLMVARKEGLDPPQPTPAAKLAHFELADESGQWHAAEATIVGASVVVRSPTVQQPIAVRYACSGSPSNANLYNKGGLPASPFCSDLELLSWDRSK